MEKNDMKKPTAHPQPPHSRRNEHGSVLIYIFIAIAVLAALSFAVSKSGRESAETINNEKSDLWATELFDYSNMLRRAVSTVNISGGTDNDLCFDSSGWGDNSYNHPSCSDTSTQIFNINGGSATFQRPNVNILDNKFSTHPAYQKWYITGANSVVGVGDDCDPTGPCNELLAVLPFIRRDACVAVNVKMGVTDELTAPPTDDAGFDITTPFIGAFPDGDVVNDPLLNGKRIGCFQATGGTIDAAYIFYSVLIAR